MKIIVLFLNTYKNRCFTALSVYLNMDKKQAKPGRPAVPAENKKKNRGISMTDAEYKCLEGKAAAANKGVSAYVVATLDLK